MDILDSLENLPVVSFGAGDYLLKQGERTDTVFFLLDGSVKISRDNHDIGILSDKGAILGEMSVLLDQAPSANVQCLEDSRFYRIDSPRQYFAAHPDLMLHIARVLAVRLFNLTQYLVDVKTQYEGHDHLSMVDEVLSTILNQQQSKVLNRPDSKRPTPDY